MSYWIGFLMAILIISGCFYINKNSEKITKSVKEYKKLTSFTGILAGFFLALAVRWFFMAL